MNAQTRKQIAKISERLQPPLLALDNLNSELEQLHDDEQEKFDNLSEGLQASEKGEALEQAAEKLEEAQQETQTALDAVQEAIDLLSDLMWIDYKVRKGTQNEKSTIYTCCTTLALALRHALESEQQKVRELEKLRQGIDTLKTAVSAISKNWAIKQDAKISEQIRDLPCTITTDDKLWYVAGLLASADDAFLEWCYDEEDAKSEFERLSTDNTGRYDNLSWGKYQPK